MNLYRVTLKGMTMRIGGSTCYGVSYVVAENPDDAYSIVKKDLDDRGIGYSHDKALDKVELLAENSDYPDCGYRLYV